MTTRTFAALVFAGVLTVSGSVAHAQTTSIRAPGPVRICTVLMHNMSRGATDATTDGEVTRLQSALVAAGYLSAAPVGIFGPLTQAAVTHFQKDHSLYAVGYVGPLTRGLLKTLSCSGGVSGVSMTSMTPSSGMVGTQVTLGGTGFTDNNIVFFGPGALARIPSTDNGTKLTFTVPNAIGPYCEPGHPCPLYLIRLTTPGEYDVYVQNASGSSSPIAFTLATSTTTSSPLSITGLDVPTTLPVGNSGGWVVHVATSASTDSLSYSIDWGDGGGASTGALAIPTTGSTSGVSVDHIYGRTGTYTAVFTVMDGKGDSTSASSITTVTPIY